MLKTWIERKLIPGGPVAQRSQGWVSAGSSRKPQPRLS